MSRLAHEHPDDWDEHIEHLRAQGDLARKERRESLRCPRCGGPQWRAVGAISRTDNATEICPDCGLEEALEAPDYTPRDAWPISEWRGVRR